MLPADVLAPRRALLAGVPGPRRMLPAGVLAPRRALLALGVVTGRSSPVVVAPLLSAPLALARLAAAGHRNTRCDSHLV